MNYQKELIKSLINYILVTFGLSNNIIYDTIGIYKNEFKSNKSIKIEFNELTIKEFPIFSASVNINKSKFSIAGSIIKYENEYSGLAVFKLDNYNVYGIKYEIDEQNKENIIFLVSKIKGNWSRVSLYDKIIACAGIEKLNDSGMIFKPEPLNEFYDYLIELVEM